MYRFSTRTRQVTIGGKTVTVDSKLEERIIRELDTKGYTWAKPTVGINAGRHNYTPDLEISLQYNGRTHRAILEIKPGQLFFNSYISKRMIGIRRHYETELFILYFDRDRAFYRLDRTGTITPFELPPPGAIPIHKLYKPVSVKARPVYQHRYIKKVQPGIIGLKLIGGVLELFMKAVAPARKRRRGKKKPLI